MTLPTNETPKVVSKTFEQSLDDCYDPDFFIPMEDAQFSNMLASMEQIRPYINDETSDNQAM